MSTTKQIDFVKTYDWKDIVNKANNDEKSHTTQELYDMLISHTQVEAMNKQGMSLSRQNTKLEFLDDGNVKVIVKGFRLDENRRSGGIMI